MNNVNLQGLGTFIYLVVRMESGYHCSRVSVIISKGKRKAPQLPFSAKLQLNMKYSLGFMRILYF